MQPNMASRRNSTYDESDDLYSDKYDSDDFISDEDVVSIKQTDKKANHKRSNPYLVANARGRGKNKGRGTNTSKQSTPRPGDTSVAKRMLSASRIKMNEYRNQLEELNSKIRDLAVENKTLKKMQFRHEKALGKFEEKESELPQLLTKHSNEVRALREQNRKLKEKYNTTDRYLRDAEDEIDVLKARLKKYKDLCESKGLKERDELNRKVQQADLDLEQKDSRIKELERHIEKLNKNHKHEIGIEIAHHKETKKQLKQLEEKQKHALESLREKEKELEIKNIYSNRIMKPPHKLPASYNGTPFHTPPPTRKKRIPSLTELSSRDKAKLYEVKRREEVKQKVESPKRSKKLRESWKSSTSNINDTSINDTSINDTSINDTSLNKYEKHIKSEADADLWVKREQERIDREKKEAAEREERIKLDEEMRREREQMKHESERIKRLELEREERVREEERRRLVQEERTKKENEEREVLRREEENKRLREEAEMKEAEMKLQREAEQERLKNDPKVIEDRKRKDLLLARLKEIDESEKTQDPLLNRESPQHATFLGSSKDQRLNNYSPGVDSISSFKSSYSFSKPVENMHQGLPSHDDVTVPYLEKQRKIKAQKEDLEIDGYRPSFAHQNTFNTDSLNSKSPLQKRNSISKNTDFSKTSIPSNADRKNKLMNELFGKKSEDTPSKKEDIFSVNKSTTSSDFPWNDKPKTSYNTSSNSDTINTIFSGNNTLFDNDTNDNSKMLPRRIRQPANIISSKPAVSAIDHLDDDIEEVML